MTLLLHDAKFLLHDTGRHVETADRLRAITRQLDKAGLVARCTPLPFTAIADESILAVHERAMLEKIADLAKAGGGRADPDTVVSRDSPMVARLAAGAACAAVDAVLAGKDKTALCLVRPPGHHATPNRIMGFCLFNTIALAARRALDHHKLSRILIVDWDVHHGNGTQDIFYRDPRAFFLSIHRYGDNFYPGTGARDETGAGPGLGFNRNVPLAFGVSRQKFFDEFSLALDESAKRIRPELVLISAGFDAHHADPIGSLGLETEDYTKLTRLVRDVAKTHAQGRVVSCLEGGYNVQALAESVEAHLATLLSGDAP